MNGITKNFELNNNNCKSQFLKNNGDDQNCANVFTEKIMLIVLIISIIFTLSEVIVYIIFRLL